MITLTPRDRPELLALLRREPAVNIFMLSLLKQSRGSTLSSEGTFFGLATGSALRAVAYTTRAGLCVPYSPSPADAYTLGVALRRSIAPRLLVGPRQTVDATWDALRVSARARLNRAHRLYVLHRGEVAANGHPELRTALPRDLDLACELAARMQAEELGVDPRTVDEARFRRRVASLIAQDQFYVVPAGGQFGFQASASSCCDEGAQVEAVYTPPALRGRGYATRGLAAMCRLLLDEFPMVTLHVNEDNETAIRLYQRVGFHPDAAFRLISL